MAAFALAANRLVPTAYHPPVGPQTRHTATGQAARREASHRLAAAAAAFAVLAAGRCSQRRRGIARRGKSDLADLDAFLAKQRERPPTEDPLGKPLVLYNDSPFDLMFIAVFRGVMSMTSGFQSPLSWWGSSAYEGMLEVAHAMQWKKNLQETEDSSLAVIENLIGESGREKFRTMMKPDKFGTELNAWITAVFFPFMVGKCEVEERTHKDVPRIPEGETWKNAVKIEKCRWLERSGCTGMCVGLCKRPMQRMFGGILGMPLSMEPNMEDLSCTMVFGKEPTPWEQDDLREQPCFATCATASKGGSCPKLK